jgi:hypothetical protein
MNSFKARAGVSPIDLAAEVFSGAGATLVSWDKDINLSPRLCKDYYVWKLFGLGGDGEISIEWCEELRSLSISASVTAKHFTVYTQTGLSQTKTEGESFANATYSLVEKFVDVVKKPWDEWSEEEVMEDPMWVCLRMEETGEISETAHAMMAMESYRDPSSKWVKRYFKKAVCND